MILKILDLIFEKFNRDLDEKLTWFLKSTLIKSNTHLTLTLHTQLFKLVIKILTFYHSTKKSPQTPFFINTPSQPTI